MTTNLSLLCTSYVISFYRKNFKHKYGLIIRTLSLKILISLLKHMTLQRNIPVLKRKNFSNFAKKNCFCCDCWRCVSIVWFWCCHSGLWRFGQGPLNPHFLQLKRLPIFPWFLWVLTAVFCKKDGLGLLCFFLKFFICFMKVPYRSPNVFDKSFTSLSMASWVVLNLASIRYWTSLFVEYVHNRIISFAKIMNWHLFPCKKHQFSFVVFPVCSSKFIWSFLGIFPIYFPPIWLDSAS